jgi:hypothetical protein
MDNAKPKTLNECFTWLQENLSEKQINDLRSLEHGDLWQTHYTLDKIVQEKLLRDNPPLQQRLDKSAFCDDPDLAGQIVTAFWDHLRMKS